MQFHFTGSPNLRGALLGVIAFIDQTGALVATLNTCQRSKSFRSTHQTDSEIHQRAFRCRAIMGRNTNNSKGGKPRRTKDKLEAVSNDEDDTDDILQEMAEKSSGATTEEEGEDVEKDASLVHYLTWALVTFGSMNLLYYACREAYEIRMYAIREYGRVIHE